MHHYQPNQISNRGVSVKSTQPFQTTAKLNAIFSSYSICPQRLLSGVMLKISGCQVQVLGTNTGLSKPIHIFTRDFLKPSKFLYSITFFFPGFWFVFILVIRKYFTIVLQLLSL
jgi:hypothetical protein